jgi:adenosylcobinamide kinase/adenosylcobinamide-phosphate guanylyltransferase
VLAVLTGPVRSGKSRAALDLARSSGRPVVLAVAGLAADEEMERRIARHRAERGDDIRVMEIAEADRWLDDVAPDACLVLDCLGTLVARLMRDAPHADAETARPEEESALEARVDAVVDGLLARGGDTVIVTNEVGWGVVPATPSGRLFRDAIGRANARLTRAADAAWLIVAGRAIDLVASGDDVVWPR